MWDVALRTALWESYNHLCAYCGQLVSFSEMQVDHVIPASLNMNPAERTHVLTALGLPPAADLDDAWNRLPSHGHCNRPKTDNLYHDSTLRFFLERAAKMEPEVLRLAARLKEQSRSERLKAAIAIAVAAGTLSVDEVARAAVQSGSTPRLMARARAGNPSSQLIQAVAEGEAVSELLMIPILPREDGLEVLSMSRGHESVEVVTGADWSERRRTGFRATTTYDIKEETFFKTAYATLRALETASPSLVSFIPAMPFGADGAPFLPASLLPYLSPDAGAKVENWIARRVPLDALAKTEGVTLEHSGGGLMITWNRMTAYLTEVLRADLDGDGVEDLLYSGYSRVHEGTFGAGHIGVLTRRSNDALFQEILIPQLQP
jgi:hypothetical protein